jgi:PAS domain S-box-containing protein
MADLVRAFDWSATPLGPIESWRDPLVTCVNLLLSSLHPMFLWWGPEAIQFYNDAYRPSFGAGMHHPSALGQPARECWTEIWNYIEFRLNAVMRHGQATWYENQLVPILRNGRLEDVYWTWSDSPVRDGDGNVVGVMVVCAETTDRVIAERELNRNRERLQLALDAADLGAWSYNPRDETFTADATMQRIFGAPEPTGDHDFWQLLLHPDDRRPAREAFAEALAGLRMYRIEYRVLHPEGVRWIRSKGKVLESEDGTKGMFAIVEDITQSKLAEIEMRERARDLRESQRIGKMGSWRLILGTGELTWSEEVYRIMEHDPGLPVLNYASNMEIIEADSRHRLQAAVDQCIATGQSYELDVKMHLPSSGKTVWLATRGEAVFSGEGNNVGAEARVIELRGTVRDITDRKLAEEALRGSEERLQFALETARLGTWSYDAATDTSTGDAAMLRMFGSSRASGDFNYWIEFVHPDDRETVGTKFRASVAGQAPYESEYRIVRPSDGEERWIRSRGRMILERDQPLRMAVIVEDITDRKHTEAALLRTEKLAAVGRLASSIAHEINNPLESVTNLLYLAKLGAADPTTLEYLSLAEQELSRASAITTQTLRFHRQSSRPTQVSCDDLVANVLGILRSRLLNARVTVEVRKRATRPVLCFDGEIRQVIYNLLINAVDAMQQQGGRLFLRSREGHHHATGRSGLILTIADTGTGIPSRTLAKIFEPFYSTKGGAGTGLGLWISKEIVGRHHGQLRVRSSQRPGHTGTVFTIFLPCDFAIG